GAVKAYYLAESGYRYAASQYVNAGTTEDARDEMLESLDNRTVRLGGGAGSFNIRVYPYFFTTTNFTLLSLLNPNLRTKVMGSVPPGLSLGSGTIKVTDLLGNLLGYVNYSSATISGDTVTFRMSGLLGLLQLLIPQGAPIYLVAKPSGIQTFQKSSGHDYITLANTGSANAFPTRNGTFKFEFGVNVYCYKIKEGNVLKGVTIMGNPDGDYNWTLTSADTITLLKYVRLDSTGTVGNAFGTARTVSYNMPVASIASDQQGSAGLFSDLFSSLASWTASLGSFVATTIEGSSAMKVLGAVIVNVSDLASFIGINLAAASTPAFDDAWKANNKKLSYDAQVKIRYSNQPFYMAGLSFRLTDIITRNRYGVAFMRSNSLTGGSTDGVPNSILPSGLDNTPMIVLWRQGNNASGQSMQWLAYKTLTTADNVVDANGYLKPWSTILVRVVEKVVTAADNPSAQFPVGTRVNDIQVYIGDTSDHGSGDTNPQNNVRLGDARGAFNWPPRDPDQTIAATDHFSLIQWSSDVEGSVQRLGAGSQLNSVIRTNTYVTDPGWTDFPITRPEVGLDVFGNNAINCYFSDYGINFLDAGGGATVGFFPPIQQ
ncbi:MAG: hypothetical protein PHY31_06620, partial [Smithellaceae bacterium]|nr:hypothetical protein [Smithellaceae bacterium]